MFSRFFIDRPIFATVISIVIVIAGVVSIAFLPVAQYPEITPPTVQVSTIYPGANAGVVADTVAAPIEQEVNGVEGMLYMSSSCGNDGSYRLTITFKVGTDLDMASILVNNRVVVAAQKLPEDVRRQGIVVKKQSPDILMFISLTSPDGHYNDLFLSNFATLRIRDELSRIDGVGEVMVFGSAAYSMRIWLDPDKLKARDLTTQDVVDAIREQNVQVAAGQIGQPPAPAGQVFQYTINTHGRLAEAREFEEIIIKTAEGGRVTRVRDVARVELGAQEYNTSSQMNGVPSASIGVYQLPGANAIDVAKRVSFAMERLGKTFPEGVKYSIPFNTTKFVDVAIREVVKTLVEASLLVFLVIFVFLQDWRATLIPAVTIPVSLIGTFAVMVALGFSINMLTLFGLVLAIGIVVDDAIVVVENASRHIEESGMSAREATILAMREVTGPIVATTFVILAVFVPSAFMPGITGRLYRQFALTIAASTVFSAFNALSLSPALCAIVLRKSPERRSLFFRGFNFLFDGGTSLYRRIVRRFTRHLVLGVILLFALVAPTWWRFSSMPTGFLPLEDQGYMIASVQLPDAASLERTTEVAAKLNQVYAETEGIHDWVSIVGFSLLDGGMSSNSMTSFLVLDDWEERLAPNLSQFAILGALRSRFDSIQEASIIAFPPPAIRGVGVAGGFQLQLQDQGGTGMATLQEVAQEITRLGNTQTGLAALNTTFRANVPQIFADIDREQVKNLNVPLSTVFGTLQAFLGSAYVNDFNQFGRTYQVKVQADHEFRVKPEDIRRLEVRSANDKMIPLGTLVNVRDTLGPQVVSRYNLYPTAAITGEAAPGFSSGQALRIMEGMLGRMLPSSLGFEWTGMSYQERMVGSQGAWILLLAITLVLLVLAAQYESWTSPAAVILSVPLALVGTVAAHEIRGMEVNVYTQIGLVLLVALACKNAILIVEFAREMRHGGKGIAESAIDAALVRLRPILMTSFAFIMGVWPLVIATGAGAASRQSLGTTVFGGMLSATFLAVLFIPMAFVIFQRLSEWYSPMGFEPPARPPDSKGSAP
ncbi:MAG: Efflux pump membrane transporter BepE [bacterium]|nr:Efflux pump membrane transporter BepE [bacterium]